MTNFVRQHIQKFFDISTDPDTMQVITITSGGNDLVMRTLPFFSAFKKFKLGKVSVRFVPASTLPVDPTGLSYEAGENTVDPRDQFNPGLVRITNGEDFYNDVDANTPMSIYYNMMMDKRWFKFHLQNGFKRTAIPKFWNVGQMHQDAFPGSISRVPSIASVNPEDSNYGYLDGSLIRATSNVDGTTTVRSRVTDLDEYSFIQTGKKQSIGWLPTDAFQPIVIDDSADPVYTGGIHEVPEVELMKVILPKAYKTKFYYRVFVDEVIMFKDPVTYYTSGPSYVGQDLDRFVKPTIATGDPVSLNTVGSTPNIIGGDDS